MSRLVGATQSQGRGKGKGKHVVLSEPRAQDLREEARRQEQEDLLGQTEFKYGPYKGLTWQHVADEHACGGSRDWIDALTRKPVVAKYQREFLNWYMGADAADHQTPSKPECEVCEYRTTKGTNIYVTK